MKDTWASRDLPVLDATVTLIDEGELLPEVTDIAQRSGLDIRSAFLALLALKGEYVDLQITGEPGASYVRGVTSAARRAVGQWPTPESLADQLAAAFRTAAETEPDEEKQSRLRQVAGFLGSAGRDIAVGVIGQVISHSTGMG